MKVQEFMSEHIVHTKEQLESVLAKRSEGGTNSFWLCPDPNDVPTMLILVVEDRTCLHFFPEEGEPGFSSDGTIDDLPTGATSVFYMDGQPQKMNNETIVPFVKTIEAAKEIFLTAKLPTSIEWNEL